jgi:hypothetical protein
MTKNLTPDTLSNQQHLAILALLSGKKIHEAAAAAGVSRESLYTWMHKDYDFINALQDERGQLRQRILDESVDAGTRALRVLVVIFEDANLPVAHRITAAKVALDAVTAGAK